MKHPHDKPKSGLVHREIARDQRPLRGHRQPAACEKLLGKYPNGEKYNPVLDIYPLSFGMLLFITEIESLLNHLSRIPNPNTLQP
tara:strand:- start:21944 stop:22198 length:255 start_codon:yes stop_codon:yes gene_type:complete